MMIIIEILEAVEERLMSVIEFLRELILHVVIPVVLLIAFGAMVAIGWQIGKYMVGG